MNVPGAVASGVSSKLFWSLLNVIGVIFAAKVNVIDGYGLSTSGGMSAEKVAVSVGHASHACQIRQCRLTIVLVDEGRVLDVFGSHRAISCTMCG